MGHVSVAALWLLSRHLDPPWLSPQGKEHSSGDEVGHLEKLRTFIWGWLWGQGVDSSWLWDLREG